MVQFYYKLVLAGKLALADVPEKFREAVQRLLEENGEVVG